MRSLRQHSAYLNMILKPLKHDGTIAVCLQESGILTMVISYSFKMTEETVGGLITPTFGRKTRMSYFVGSTASMGNSSKLSEAVSFASCTLTPVYPTLTSFLP